MFNVLLSHGGDDTDGFFRLWIDGDKRADQTVEIGNDPDGDYPDGFKALDAMDLRFGVYRKAPESHQKFYLDDVWFSDNPGEAMDAE